MAKQRARRSSPLYLPSAFELFAPSRNLFMRHFNVFGVLYMLPFLFWIRSWVDTPAHGHHYWTRTTDANYAWTFPNAFNVAFIGFAILWFIFIIIVGAAVEIMTQRAQLDAVEGHPPTLTRCWQTLKTYWQQFALLYLSMALIIGIWFAPILISAWLSPIGIVGLFMIRRYMFAPYVMLDKKCGVKEALEESHRLSLLNSAAVWGVIGVMLLIGLIGVVPIIGSLASFVAGALYSIAPAIRYQQLKKIG